MKVNSPPTALQLSQVDWQKNHLKPQLISLSEREQNFKCLSTSLDGMCHRQAKDGAREKVYADSKCHFRKRQALPFEHCHWPVPTVNTPLIFNCATFVSSRKLHSYCNNSPCVKTLSRYACFLTTSHNEGAATLYISINSCWIPCNVTIAVCLLLFSLRPLLNSCCGWLDDLLTQGI